MPHERIIERVVDPQGSCGSPHRDWLFDRPPYPRQNGSRQDRPPIPANTSQDHGLQPYGSGRVGGKKFKGDTANHATAGAAQREVISVTEIIGLSLPLRVGKLSGLYFLISKGVVVYVGKAKVIFTRIAAHVHQKRIAFDRVTALFHPEEGLAALERRYIKALAPKYNFADNHRREYTPSQIPLGTKTMPLEEAAQYISGKWFPISGNALRQRIHLGRGPRALIWRRQIFIEFASLEKWAEQQHARKTAKKEPSLMPKIIPLHGSFDDWRALLGRIMEDDATYGVVILTFGRTPEDGPTDFHVGMGSCGLNRSDMAVASVILQAEAADMLRRE